VFQPKKSDAGLLKRAKANDKDCFILINKPPRWNDQVGAYVLNFCGRVTMASVKNFQLVHPDDHDTVVLQFGRVGPNMFNMDYRYPLSPMQGYCARTLNFHHFTVCALLHDSLFGLLKQFRLQTRMRINISTRKYHAALYRVQHIKGAPQRFFSCYQNIYIIYGTNIIMRVS